MNDAMKVNAMQAMALLEGALRAADGAVAASLLKTARNALEQAIDQCEKDPGAASDLMAPGVVK